MKIKYIGQLDRVKAFKHVFLSGETVDVPNHIAEKLLKELPNEFKADGITVKSELEAPKKKKLKEEDHGT